MKPATFGLFALAAIATAATAVATAPAAAAETGVVRICVRSEAWVEGKMIVTTFNGPDETRWSSGWKDIRKGGVFCYDSHDARAFNVIIEGWTTKWVRACDINRRPATNIDVTMTGTAFGLSCQVF